MTPTLGGFSAFRKPVEREAFAPGFDLWRQLSRPLRRTVRTLIRLPDRGGDARPDDVPPEYFRFPPY